MKNGLAYFSLLLLFVACSEKEVFNRPVEIIPSDSMSVLIADVHVLNGMHQHREIRKNKLQPLVIEEYNALFDSLGVATERFEKSIEWWSHHPDSLEGILDEALNLLNEKAENYKANKPSAESEIPVKSADEQKLKQMINEKKTI